MAREQAVIDHAYDCLRVMRERAEYLKSLGYLGGNIHADTGLTPEMAATDEARKQRRIDSLADPATALCFGRIDRADGERFYIGRRHVEDRAGDPLITDWRAPMAVPFYRATIADRLGLERRRRFVAEGRELIDIFEEDLQNPAAAAASAYVPDPLLAEVEHARTGTMRDVVATIQAEQDAIIRAPLEECIVVQGGPGTGKTAVGLHRVAYLLYSHREQLERERVLILGPNRVFFRYISQVLPSLGETAAVQLTIGGLTGGRFRVRGEESPEGAALKGDLRMAKVVNSGLLARLGSKVEDLAISTGFGTVTIDAADIERVVKQGFAGSRAVNDGREFVRDQLVDLAWRGYMRRYGTDPSMWATFVERVRTDAGFKKALDKLCPTLSAADVIRRLYGNRTALEQATRGILSDAERELLARKPAPKLTEERWTPADLAVLDEAEALLNGTPQQYGHIVVDEAQDLSQMQLRMVARRARRGSMTVLGDLAQASAPGGQASWDRAIEAFAAPSTRYEELTVGYRVPGPILDYANRLLADAAPDVRPPTSARVRGQAPRIVTTEQEQLASSVADEAATLAASWTSTAVVVPESLHDVVAEALTAAGLNFTDIERTSELGQHLTLITPASTKGLEFDAVVAVEPARVVAEHVRGTRLLYVVLTRAVQELTIVHSGTLPASLAA